jgi:hypothetical protein
MGAPEEYVREVRTELTFFPTWLPYDRIEVGTFGVLKDGRLVREGQLSDFGIEVRPRESPPGAGFHKSKGVVARASTGAHVEDEEGSLSAGVNLEFTRKHAWMLACQSDVLIDIENIYDVKNEVLGVRRTRTNQWHDTYCLVTAVRRVRQLRVLISKRKSTRVAAHGNGVVKATSDLLLSAELKLEYSSDDVFVVERATNTTPLYELRRIRHPTLLRAGLEPIADGPKTDDWDLLPVPYDAATFFSAGHDVDWGA